MNLHIQRLYLSIDHALAISYRRDTKDGNAAFVAYITLVKGIPFYGFHVGYRYFMKIYIYNPLHITRLADLLRQGAVLRRPIQPYESHLQYLLQWMCDYNLYGCSYLDCSIVKFRSPVPDSSDVTSKIPTWHDRPISESVVVDEDVLLRQSHCSIEIDVCVQDILNRLEIKERPLHHDFVERTNPIAPDEKLVHSVAGLWRDEKRRRKARMGEENPGSSPFPTEALVSVSADPRDTQPGGWVHEEEYFRKMLEILEAEQLLQGTERLDFATFVKHDPQDKEIHTVFQSIEDLFPSNLSKNFLADQASPGGFGFPNGALTGDVTIDVDEDRILSLDEEDSSFDSDEELSRNMEVAERILDQIVKQKKDHNFVQRDTGNEAQDEVELSEELPKESQFIRRHGHPILNDISGGLTTLGIRRSQDYLDTDTDHFKIPRVYALDAISSGRAEKRASTFPTASEALQKRRKFDHDDPVCSQTGAIPNLSDGTGLNALKMPKRVTALIKKENEPKNWPSAEQLQPNLNLKYHVISKNRSVISKSLSQGMNTAKGRGASYTDSVLYPSTVKFSPRYDSPPVLERRSTWPSKTTIRPGEDYVAFDTLPQPPSSRPSLLTHYSLLDEDNDSGKTSNVAFVASHVRQGFRISMTTPIFCFSRSSPASASVSTIKYESTSPFVKYPIAYYSDEHDVPDRIREYAGNRFKLGSTTVPFLPDFNAKDEASMALIENSGTPIDVVAIHDSYQRQRRTCSLRTWEIRETPPLRHEVQLGLDSIYSPAVPGEPGCAKRYVKTMSQIDAPTQKLKHGFKYSQKQVSTSVQHETQYMSLMSLEIHVNTRGNLVPNPEEDEIACLFWCLQSQDGQINTNYNHQGTHVGILALSEMGGLAHRIAQQVNVEVVEESSELELMNKMVDIVRNYDPDILTGFEVHGGSWGYVIERARHKYDYNLCDEFSRMKSQSHGKFGRDSDRWGFNHTSTIRVTGRHMINIWRAMRGELNLLQYTMENVVFHLLHRRIPHYAFADLTTWYNSSSTNDLSKVINYYVLRVQLDLNILEKNELIPRTSEQARLLGVDFFSVFSRGSQFKVESLMFRIAKPENFMLVSPSRKQVGQQNALECLPLVMEPQSAFYSSPLLVLDFQALYPSVMIAYNYCYSTFLGRVSNWRGQNKMGFTNLQREARLLELLQENINIAPNGMMYVKPKIRKSLLAKMLCEILETRVMVKSGMNADKADKTLQRLLNNRQLALKLIANVTYGYTSASFSGRMPCSEIADSIVQTARETLEKAITLIHSVKRWGAEVVYGDTDSLFVYLKGRTKDEAFDIGNEIANAVSKINPRPVKLKFEKVYLPCVLLAKKRYVGFKYETKGQVEPDFDAKGIETVRRDGTPAEQKIEEKALKILFRTADLSQVKDYFQQQCAKIMRGHVSIQDFCFAKEVKLGTYSDRGPPPPGALISTRKMHEDPRAEPQYGERVPYVVIAGAPGARLIDRCVAPEVLLHDEHKELDAEYYISKNLIPPLERIFNLIGCNVRQWYDEMPKSQRLRRIEEPVSLDSHELLLSKKTLESYMKSSSCFVCTDKLEEEFPICDDCLEQPDFSILTLRTRLGAAEAQHVHLEKVCRSCSGLPWGDEVRCDSKDCPVFYTRTRLNASLKTARAVMEPVMRVLGDFEDDPSKW